MIGPQLQAASNTLDVLVESGDWKRDESHVIGLFLNGEDLQEADPRGEPVMDDSFLLLFNAHHEDVTFTLPAASYGSIWESELSTAEPLLEARAREYAARSKLEVRSRSVYVLRRGPLGSA